LAPIDHKRRGLFPWETEDQIGALLKMVSTSMRREIEKAIRPLGLTPQQGQCLRVLSICPGSTHSDLERMLCVEKPSITSLVTGVEKKGWAVRQQHPEDARIKQVYLTDEGEALVKQCIDIVDQVKARLNQALSAEETAILSMLLKKLLIAYD
jgi:DNA-binding MarR family transcriptional regulator